MSQAASRGAKFIVDILFIKKEYARCARNREHTKSPACHTQLNTCICLMQIDGFMAESLDDVMLLMLDRMGLPKSRQPSIRSI